MQFSQSKQATKAFVAFLESHLSTIHPAYQRNRKVKGIRHEYFRELECGLFAIHSVLCMKGTYYHCFCLSRHHTHPAPSLHSPFTIGGRCDHSYSVTDACRSDLGLSPVDPAEPFVMSCSHGFRKGADRIIRRCMSEAESRLLPYYLSVWSESRDVLQDLLDRAASTSPDALAASAAEYPGPRHELSCHMLQFLHLYKTVPPDQRPAFFAATALTVPDIIRDLTTRVQS